MKLFKLQTMFRDFFGAKPWTWTCVFGTLFSVRREEQHSQRIMPNISRLERIVHWCRMYRNCTELLRILNAFRLQSKRHKYLLLLFWKETQWAHEPIDPWSSSRRRQKIRGQKKLDKISDAIRRVMLNFNRNVWREIFYYLQLVNLRSFQCLNKSKIIHWNISCPYQTPAVIRTEWTAEAVLYNWKA